MKNLRGKVRRNLVSVGEVGMQGKKQKQKNCQDTVTD